MSSLSLRDRVESYRGNVTHCLGVSAANAELTFVFAQKYLKTGCADGVGECASRTDGPASRPARETPVLVESVQLEGASRCERP